MTAHSKENFTSLIRSIALAAILVAALALPVAYPRSAQALTAEEECNVAYGPEYCSQAKETKQAQAAQRTTDQLATTQIKCNLTDVTCGILKVANFALDSIAEIPFSAGKVLLTEMLAYNFGAFGAGGGQYQALFNTMQFGWSIVLAIVNMFFVLWLLWIAIGTIFDMESFTARALLPKLIIAALLINFSFPIGTAVIGLGNSIGGIFWNAIEGQGGIKNLYETVFNQSYIVQRITNQVPLTDKEALQVLQTRTVEVPAWFGLTKSVLTAGECREFISAHPGAIIRNFATTVAIYPLCERLLSNVDVANAVNRVYPEDLVGRIPRRRRRGEALHHPGRHLRPLRVRRLPPHSPHLPYTPPYRGAARVPLVCRAGAEGKWDRVERVVEQAL